MNWLKKFFLFLWNIDNVLPIPDRRLVLHVLPEHELRAGFRDAPESNLWRCTLAELDQFILECDNRALSQGEKLTNDEMRLAFGGKLALIAFREKLDEREDEARQVEQRPGDTEATNQQERHRRVR